MPVLLTCPQGHQYEGTAEGSACCPICAQSAQRATLIDPAGVAGVGQVGQVGQVAQVGPVTAEYLPCADAEASPSSAVRTDPCPSAAEGPATVGVSNQFTRVEPATAVSAARPEPPHLGMIAGYELLEVLGRGGMGIVWKARDRRLNRLVALKMILAGIHAGPQHKARFTTEALAVASLQHPNIVQIHEVGDHEGQPFLSLEFVDGEPLDKKLAGKPQPPRDAAYLVAILARAMQAAHDQGIVHRDLKPANILMQKSGGSGQTSAIKKKPDSKVTSLIRKTITPTDLRAPCLGLPKITDFGLAKRMEEDSQTVTGAIMGTPSYMAPEQATGKTHEIGPAADVYSLGAILYETLTGRPPFAGVTPLDTLRQVQTQEPVPPTRLQPRLARDLETICLKCLEKEPQRRYPTAGELADDLERFLAGEPILARPVGLWVRGVKWARRYPVIAALSLILTVAGAALVAVIVWSNIALSVKNARIEGEKLRAEGESQRAVRNYQRARKAADELLRGVAEELEDQPRMEQTRRHLLEMALAIYQEFLEEKSDDPVIRRELASTCGQVGDIYRFLGEHARSQEQYGRMIAMAAELPEPMRSEPAFQRELAAAYSGRSRSWKAIDQREAAVADAREALRLQKAVPTDPARPTAGQQELARCHYFLGVALFAREEYEEAERAYRETLRLQKTLVTTSSPVTPGQRSELARTLTNLGRLQYETKRNAEALASFEEARILQQALVDDETLKEKPGYRLELARTCNNLAVLLQGDPTKLSEAERAHGQVGALFEGLVRDFPSVPDYRNELGKCFANQAMLARSLRRFDAARQFFQLALGTQRKLAAEFPTVADYRQRLGRTLIGLGNFHRDQRQDVQAEEAYREAIGIYQRLLGDANTADYRNGLAFACAGLAHILRNRHACIPLSDMELSLATSLANGLAFLDQLANLRLAVQHQAQAVELNPQNARYRTDLCNFYLARSQALVAAGQHAEAGRAAAALAEVLPEDQIQAYRGAYWLARCVSTAEEDRKLSPTERSAVAERYAAQAIVLLRRAIARGFKNSDALARPPFDALQKYPAFRELRQELKEKVGKVVVHRSTRPDR